MLLQSPCALHLGIYIFIHGRYVKYAVRGIIKFLWIIHGQTGFSAITHLLDALGAEASVV